MKTRNLKFTEAINEAMILSMKRQKNVVCYGLGVDDPKRIFGTTKNLKEIFGSKRVFDVPASENALTGIGIGSSLNGLRPVMVHQRLDFFLYAMDQLINGAAKWSYVFGGVKSLPLTIRLIIGRGWGQGPTHSQSLQSLFLHIPGLKIVMPSNSYQAKGLLNAAIFDNKENNFKDKQLILNVNFFNQIKFVHKIKNFLAPEKLKIIFFSSFAIYNDSSKLPYYKISKSLFYEEFLRVKDQDQNICYKLFVLAGIKTESYLKNSKNNFLNKIIDVDIDNAVNFILKKINNDNNDIIYYPRIYIFLKKLLFIKKIFS